MKIFKNKLSNRNAGSSMPRVALYARVGEGEQTRGTFSNCDSQLQDLTDYAKREGLEIVASVKDEGYSAGSLRRSGLTRIRQMAQDDAIDLVLISSYDRFARSSSDFYKISEEFGQHNVQLKTVHAPQDATTAADRFAELILIGAQSHAREQKRHRHQ